MANKPLMLLPLKDSLEGRTPNGTITATGSGALRYQDGGVLVEEGTTNYVIDPFYEHGTDWYVYPPETVGMKETTEGIQHLRIDFTEDSGGFFKFTAQLNAFGTSDIGTASYEVWSSNSILIDTRLYFESGGIDNYVDTPDFAVTVPANTWVRVTHTSNTIPTKTSDGFLACYVYYVNSVSEGTIVRVRRPQIEKKSHATSFCPSYTNGVLDAGYVWNGTPHASTSTRAVSEVSTSTEDRIDSVTGSMLFALPQGATPNDSYLFFTGNWGTDDALTLNANATIGALFRSGGASADYLASTVASPDARVVYVAWTASTLTLAVNDEAPQTIPRTLPTGSTSATMAMGGVSWASSQINAPFGPFVIFGAPLTDSERDRVTALMMSGEVTWDSLHQQIGELTITVPNPSIRMLRSTDALPIYLNDKEVA